MTDAAMPQTLLLNPQGIAAYAVALADAVGGRARCGRISGRARRRLLDPARLPARPQASRPLRASLPRRSRRLLPARGRAQRRGGIDGPRACHRPRAGHRHRPRRPAPAGARRGRRGARAPRRRRRRERTAASASRTPRSGSSTSPRSAAAASPTPPPRRRRLSPTRARRLLDPSRRRRARRRRHARRRLPHAGRAVVGRSGRPSSGRQSPRAGRWASTSRFSTRSSTGTARSRPHSSMRWPRGSELNMDADRHSRGRMPLMWRAQESRCA